MIAIKEVLVFIYFFGEPLIGNNANGKRPLEGYRPMGDRYKIWKSMKIHSLEQQDAKEMIHEGQS